MSDYTKEGAFFFSSFRKQGTSDLWKVGCGHLKKKKRTFLEASCEKLAASFPCSMSHLGFSHSELVITGIPTKMTRILFFFFLSLRFIISLINPAFVL